MQELERAGSLEDELRLKQDIADLDAKLSGLNDDLLRDQVKRNRQLRYQLKAAQQLSQSEVLRQKIDELRNKKGLKFFSQERKENWARRHSRPADWERSAEHLHRSSRGHMRQHRVQGVWR